MAINYDMPEAPASAQVTEEQSIASSADTYLHRVGRAGRFGTKGVAISFVSNERDEAVLESIRSRMAVEINPYPEGGKGIKMDE